MFLTRTNKMEEIQNAVRQFFITMGVDLIPPKTVFFNDRTGILWARATAEELDIIESAVQVLNVAPPEVNIKAKFADIGQRDQKAIGFDWYLGNVLMGNNGQVVGRGRSGRLSRSRRVASLTPRNATAIEKDAT